MKVVEIILDLRRRGGAEVFFASMCKELVNHSDIELTIVSLWDGVDESFLWLKELPNVKFYSLNKKKGFDLKAASKLKKLLNTIQPDIIHTHRSVLLTYFLAFRFKKKKWKIVHTVHNVAEKEANKVTRILRKTYIRKKEIMFIGISSEITKSILCLHPNAEVKTIYNGIELPDLPTNSTVQKEFDIINVARFAQQKNHELLFDAFKSLLEYNSKMRLLCVGNGELFDDCAKKIEEKEINKNVILYGATNDVYPLLKKSKVFVLSSLYEGNPISILEAMNAGLPVVAPAVGGIPDVIINYRNGFLFEVNNKKQMVESIINILSNPELYNEMSNNNKHDVTKYSIENCVDEYLKAFYN